MDQFVASRPQNGHALAKNDRANNPVLQPRRRTRNLVFVSSANKRTFDVILTALGFLLRTASFAYINAATISKIAIEKLMKEIIEPMSGCGRSRWTELATRIPSSRIRSVITIAPAIFLRDSPG